MTLPRLYEIWHAWRKTPPLHIAFAGFVGAFRKDAPRAANDAMPGGEILAELGAAGLGALPTLPPELQAMLNE